MRCAECQAENPDGNLFCQSCGARLSTTCPACGSETGADAAFCGHCGTPLTASAPPVGAPTTGASPEVRRQLAELILGARGAAEGARKFVTVLFADIVGSTRLIDSLDPEVALDRLEPALNAMIDCVRHYEGTVNRVQGDGIMAIFGAPLSHEDHAIRACLAALAMQERISALPGVEMLIRVGLNSGEVVVRPIGTDFWLDYDAVGPVVHVAKRVEELAEPGTVCCTAATYELVKGFVEAERVGEVAVKGVGDEIVVYRPTGGTPTSSRWQVRAAQGLSAFVAREEETALLAAALDRTRRGQGQVVALVGAPGIGKSRLLHEFVSSERLGGGRVLETGSLPHGRNTSYMPIAMLLRAWFEIGADDADSSVEAALRGQLSDLGLEPAPLVPVLTTLLNRPVTDAEWLALDPPQRRQRIIDGIKTVILAQAGQAPLVLLFEDLHWIDAETQAVLDAMVEAMATAPLLLLLSHRPEYEGNWRGKSYYTRVRLDPLAASASDELLRRLVGNDDSLDRLKALLVEKTQGTPLFIEETVRTLVETGALAGPRGAYRLTKELDEIEIPGTVQAVLASRIDRLPAQQKSLLQMASVIGMKVPVVLLQEFSRRSDADLWHLLTELQGAEFLDQTRVFPDPEFTFRHAFTHDVVHDGMLLDRRRELHAALVRAMESCFAGRLDGHLEQLADHADQGQLWPEAVRYLQAAGDKAIDNSAFAAATRFLERALDVVDHLPETRSSIEQAVDIRLRLRVAIGVTGDYARWYEFLGQAEELAAGIDDATRLQAVAMSKTHVLNVVGKASEAIATGERASRIAHQTQREDQLVPANYFLAQAYEFNGDYRAAARIIADSIHLLRGDQRHRRFGTTGTASVLYYALLGYCRAALGELPQAMSASAQACAIARELDRPFDVAVSHFADGMVGLHKGEIDAAITTLRRGLDACDSAGIDIMWPVLASRLGYAYAIAGRFGEAASLAERALPRSAQMAHMHGWCHVFAGHVRLLAGGQAEARQCGLAALELAGRHEYRGVEAWALWLLGLCGDDDGAVDGQSTAWLQRAIALCRTLGLRPLQAHCQLALGRFNGTSGSEAQRDVAMATALYEELGMAFWAERAALRPPAPVNTGRVHS